VLLTGAGFTKNFGGYLASEMWAAIFGQPEIRQNEDLRLAMLDCLNFEAIYDRVLTSGDYERSRDGYVAATRRAYENMHRQICADGDPRKTGPAGAVCRRILAQFAGRGQERGFFFTLNQDLFVEQFFGTDVPMSLPGLHNQRWFHNNLGTLDEGTRVILPDVRGLERICQEFWNKGTGSFKYVKLHGSLGWTGQDGGVMVLGQTKSESIQREPLLTWYLELFREVLSTGDAHLITIGYGFRDPHINSIIADAIRGFGLRLCVLTPEEPAAFRERLVAPQAAGGVQRGEDLWHGLYYYGQARVVDLYDARSTSLPPRGRAFFDDIGLRYLR
jgi:hypothetical protein